MALDTLNRYLFRFTIQTRCEQSSQCQRTLVRLPSLSVLGYLNYTLASNQNNNNVDSVSQPVNLFPSAVTDGVGQIDSVVTTQFVSDSNVVSATKIMPVDIDPSFVNSSTDLLSQDVKDFLMKPVILASGSFGVTDTYSTFPEYLSPNDILGSNNSMMGEKLRGYYGFRATTVLRLVVNATRFQQGRYNLQFVPTGGAIVGATGNVRRRVDAINSTLVQRIQLPHVELDLNCDTEAVLKYKFNSAYGFFPMSSFTNTTSAMAFGVFKIYPYAPLVAGSGSTTCSYTLWGSFEDIELISAAVPQSGRFSASIRSKNETDKEQDSAQMGPISSSLMRVKRAADVFTKVPLLSSYASMTSWYSELLAGAASAFGWSRPVNLEHSTRVTQNYLPYAANTDAPDNSFPLSYSYKNQVGKAAGFSGTDVDEMDFSFLCSIPVYNSTATWATSDVSGTALMTISIRPLGLLVSRTVAGVGIVDIGPYQLIANMFEQWRGSMIYKLKFVKTEFHSGRLAISFSPVDPTTGNAINPTLAQTAFLHRQVIDVRECNEFTFVVPFLSTSPYKLSTQIIGTLLVHILDPLVAPNTVSSSVGIILEHCMGPDAEFAVPKKNNMNYVMGLVPQSGDPFSNKETNVCANYRGNIGISSIPPDECSNALFCVGEKISSLRTLMKLPNPVVPTVAPTASLYFNMMPFVIPFTIGTAVPVITPGTLNSDLYTLISSLYLYVRGGVRIKYIDNTAVTAAEPLVAYLGTGNVGASYLGNGYRFDTVDGSNDSGTLNRNGLPSHYWKAGYSGEVQVPAYGRYHSRLITDCMANPAGAGPNFGVISTMPDIYISRTTVPSVATLTGILRSASDDANCGVFLAVPPVSGNFL
jgi:hypothetical protein